MLLLSNMAVLSAGGGRVRAPKGDAKGRKQTSLPHSTEFCFSISRTKIFICFPKTLFATEDALEVRKQSLGESRTVSRTVSSLFPPLFFLLLFVQGEHFVPKSAGSPFQMLFFLALPATKMQATWRGFYRRKKFRHMKHSGRTGEAAGPGDCEV